MQFWNANGWVAVQFNMEAQFIGLRAKLETTEQ